MLQSSQTEKPRYSATIDQMRLRRAMYFPVDSQNSLFSGFQSERFRLLISMFLFGRDWSPVLSRPAPRLRRADTFSSPLPEFSFFCVPSPTVPFRLPQIH